MSDKNNELQPTENSSSEALSKSERIKAIKNSIHDNPDFSEVIPEGKSEPANPEPEVSAEAEDWEKELAERIARRVQKVKAEKESSAENQGETTLGHEGNPAPPVSDEESAEESSEAPVSAESEKEATQVFTDAKEIGDSAALAASDDVKPAKKKKSKKKKKKKTLRESLHDLFPRKEDKISERIRKIVFLGSCVAIVVCGTMVLSYYIDTIHTQNVYDDIANVYIDYSTIPTQEAETDTEAEEIYTLFPWAEKLLEQNDELVGYITIPGSKDDPDEKDVLSYPVVQSDDLEKYLDTSFTGETARAGTIFLDYRNSFDNVEDGILLEPNSDNLIIYGHNMQDGNMFGKLKYYRNDVNFYSEHPIINLDSNYKSYQYKIFAFFIVDAEDQTETAFDCWNYINFADETDFYDYVNEAKKRSLQLNDVDVQYGDQLLTLSTCNSIFGNDGPGRLIVMARLVRDGEDPYEGTENSVVNPNIKWPSLYYEYNDDEEYDPDAEFIPYGGTTADEETTDAEE